LQKVAFEAIFAEIVAWHGFPLAASALVATLGNANSFKNGRQVAGAKPKRVERLCLKILAYHLG